MSHFVHSFFHFVSPFVFSSSFLNVFPVVWPRCFTLVYYPFGGSESSSLPSPALSDQYFKKKPWKMKQRKPKMKVNTYMKLSTQDRCIHLANGGTLRWHTHTHLSADHSIGEDYAKMKAGPYKIVENTLEDSRKKTYGAAQAKSEGQNIHRVFQYKTGAYFLQVGGCHTKMAHHAFNRCGG